MALDDETGGDGTPLDEGGPEWGSVEEERDYWKGLAQQYAAKLMMVKRTLETTWNIEQHGDRFFAVPENFLTEIDTDLTKVIP